MLDLISLEQFREDVITSSVVGRTDRKDRVAAHVNRGDVVDVEVDRQRPLEVHPRKRHGTWILSIRTTRRRKSVDARELRRSIAASDAAIGSSDEPSDGTRASGSPFYPACGIYFRDVKSQVISFQ